MWGFPNTELAVRDWLRSQASLTDLLGGTAKIDLDPDPTLPCVVVYRAGGTTDAYVPLDRALLGFDCWGTERSRKAAMDLQVALTNCLSGLASEDLNSEVFGYSALVESVLYAPDAGGRHRYVVTALVTARRREALAS